MHSNILAFSKSDSHEGIVPKMANRHGLIAGATGTGKTVSLRVLAEAFSAAGVPVFMADVKGDLASLAFPGTNSAGLTERVHKMDLEPLNFCGFPVRYWDVFGQQGHPLRATISDMGPLLLSRLMNLNETQTGVLNIIFRIADDQGLLLIDLKDLRSILHYVGENSSAYTTQYGTISKQSVGAIQRSLLELDSQGAASFFGEPSLQIGDVMGLSSSGHGLINILSAEKLLMNPLLYSTLLLWLLSELFEEMPEIGDIDKPRLVFFFDEAHLLFKNAPKVFLDRVEQVVRLIRSKGVGIYFVTQSPLDIPDSILGQLGNRVQHGLRAFTPKDQKAVKAAAETFRSNPDLDVVSAITELAVGEALVSFLDDEGRPNRVSRTWVLPPRSLLGPISFEQRCSILSGSGIAGKYEAVLDRVSAYEVIAERAVQDDEEHRDNKDPNVSAPAPAKRSPSSKSQGRRNTTTPIERMARSAINTIGRQVARELIRGVFGTLKKR